MPPRALVLEKVAEYLLYAEKYAGARDVPDMDLPAELSLEILLAADYLGSKCLSMGVAE